ncbi:MAG: tyrosine-type recombinase/integrase [Clostridiaceae bacterium]|nr:tyrosine-type recombinase/integrase [Clostridiaceae bacterium]
MNDAKETLYGSIYENIIKENLNNTLACKKLAEILHDFHIIEIEKDVNRFDLSTNINKFLAEKDRFGLSRNSLNSYKIQLNMFLDFFKDRRIQDIKRDDIKEFLYHREDNYNISSTSSLETIRAILRVFFDWLVDEKLIEHNPVSRVKAYKIKEVEIEPLEEQEIEELRHACKSFRERAVIEFILSTGCKLNELNNMNISDINWQEATVEIKGDGRKNRVVLLSKIAINHIQQYLDSRQDGTNYLVVTERRPYKRLSNRGIQREVAKIYKRTKIKKNVSPQALRHTFAK